MTRKPGDAAALTSDEKLARIRSCEERIRQARQREGLAKAEAKEAKESAVAEEKRLAAMIRDEPEGELMYRDGESDDDA